MTSNVLTNSKRKALAALLKNNTVQQAADEIGLSHRTITRYLADDVFRAELDRRESVLLDEAGRTLILGQQKALSVIYNLMDNGENESTRRMAAKDWMEFSLRIRELRDVEQRLTALEKKVYGQG